MNVASAIPQPARRRNLEKCIRPLAADVKVSSAQFAEFPLMFKIDEHQLACEVILVTTLFQSHLNCYFTNEDLPSTPSCIKTALAKTTAGHPWCC